MIERALITGIFVALLAGQFGRFELTDRLVNVYIHELLMGVWLLVAAYRQRKEIVQYALHHARAFSSFLAWTAVTFLIGIPLFTLSQNSLSMLYFARIVLYGIFIISCKKWIGENSQRKTVLLSAVYTFSWLLVGISFVQYITVKDLWSMYRYGWDPHQFRIFATYLDVYVAAALFGILFLFWFDRKKYLLSLLLLVCLALTFSRSGYIAAATAFIVYAVVHRNYLIGVGLVALLGILILFVPKQWGEGVNLLRTVTIQSRLADAQLGIRLWSKAPVTGHGYNRLRYVKEQMGLLRIDDRSHSASSFHSSYLIILATTGIVGLALCLWTLYTVFRPVELIPYGALLGVMAVFDNVLLYGMIVCVMFFVAVLSHPLHTSR
jgi:O-antigen ligase